MPVFLSNSTSDNAIPVPYPAGYPRPSNYGFLDLRGNPDAVAEIPEVARTPALRALLVRFASEAGPLFTVGCDVGHHVEAGALQNERYVSGGYVQFALVRATYNEASRWARLFNDMQEGLKARVADDYWRVHLRLSPILVRLDNLNQMQGSVHVDFFACAANGGAARKSRERLINAINASITATSINRAFGKP